ncbi:MAG: FkbM family methyltransferase [Nodosilinea sp.]
MSFVSYAQNYEDVVLWRALSKVETGFYIDVGAAWPDVHSVTKAFYDRGWSGINIEPNPALFPKLSAERSQDVNLQLAISDQPGNGEIYLIGETGISTFEPDIATRHALEGWSSIRTTVAVETLATVWRQHVPVGQDVHFLKVDVEGFEKAVLTSNDWTQYRSWIVVVEATLPLTQVESYEDWEHILLDANYIFVYADGLNRFYLAAEHRELQSAFRYPPNLFDNFISQNELALRRAQERIHILESELAEEHESVYHWWATAYNLRHESSLTWRITAPLRRLERYSRSLPLFSTISTTLRAQGKQLGRQAARLGMTTIAKQPVLKANLLSLLNRSPALERQIRRLMAQNRAAISTAAQSSDPSEKIEGLTNSSLSILNRKISISAESPKDVLQAIGIEITLSPEAQVLSSQREGD